MFPKINAIAVCKKLKCYLNTRDKFRGYYAKNDFMAFFFFFCTQTHFSF